MTKVIDFGIAKAIGQDLAERTLYTEQGQLLGTPEYMSPEQAEMSSLGVDSTTDIYSLGVILYELLTGVLPFDSKTLRSRGLAEISRVIRESDAAKPSTRITTVSDRAAVAAAHSTDPRTLRSQLEGDLDWICMRALEKQRTRRYAAASELAADIERHLRHEPVLAGPPSIRYKLGRFVRRNRVAVALTGLLVLAFLVGFVSTTLALIDARDERDRAENAQRAAEHNNRREAAVNVLLLHGIGFAHPSVLGANELTVVEMLDKAAANIPELFPHAEQTRQGSAVPSCNAVK